MNTHGTNRDYVYVQVAERENLSLESKNDDVKLQVKIKSEQSNLLINEGILNSSIEKFMHK